MRLGAAWLVLHGLLGRMVDYVPLVARQVIADVHLPNGLVIISVNAKNRIVGLLLSEEDVSACHFSIRDNLYTRLFVTWK